MHAISYYILFRLIRGWDANLKGRQTTLALSFDTEYKTGRDLMIRDCMRADPSLYSLSGSHCLVGLRSFGPFRCIYKTAIVGNSEAESRMSQQGYS